MNRALTILISGFWLLASAIAALPPQPDERDLPTLAPPHPQVTPTRRMMSLAVENIITPPPRGPADWIFPARIPFFTRTLAWDQPAYAVSRFDIEASADCLCWTGFATAYTNHFAATNYTSTQFFRVRAYTPDNLCSELCVTNGL